MALCNHTSREIFFNFAFCGPSGAGRSTSLQFIHQKLDPHFRGELEYTTVGRGERMVSMEVLPVESTWVSGYRLRLQLNTLTGPSFSNDSLSQLLEGVDGLVYVADSLPDRQQANAESLQAARQALELGRLDPDALPTVFQFNKRDLPEAVDPDEIDEHLSISRPSFLTCALSGYQVMATFDALLQMVLKRFHSEVVLTRSDAGEEVILSR